MKNAEPALAALKTAGAHVDNELKKIIETRAAGPAARMYGMMSYALGFVDEHLKPTDGLNGGKRFRPSLCLLVAGMYGARDKLLDAALAIELFHNFSLVHDDVEDGDEMRRGRPTVWKVFGVNHAINAGDALLIMALEHAAHAPRAMATMVSASFAQVVEGQYLDFEMSSSLVDTTILNEATYVRMVEKKTSALVGACTEAAGIAAAQNKAECARLREYGALLGLAYQIADDYRSLWSSEAKTGKNELGDIRSRKRTLPFIVANKDLATGRLAKLYSLERALSDVEIKEAKALIESTAARAYTISRIHEHARAARAIAETLSVSDPDKALLTGVVDALIPESV